MLKQNSAWRAEEMTVRACMPSSTHQAERLSHSGFFVRSLLLVIDAQVLFYASLSCFMHMAACTTIQVAEFTYFIVYKFYRLHITVQVTEFVHESFCFVSAQLISVYVRYYNLFLNLLYCARHL